MTVSEAAPERSAAQTGRAVRVTCTSEGILRKVSVTGIGGWYRAPSVTIFLPVPVAMPRQQSSLSQVAAALDKGRPDEASRLAARILRTSPGNAAAHNFAAIAFMQQRKPIEARPHAQKAVDLDAKNHRYRSNLATTLMLLGELDAAMSHLDQAVTRKPDYPLARRYRGMLHSRLERYDEAVADLEVAAQQEPDHAETRVLLAEALIELGRVDQAMSALRSAETIQGGQNARWQYVWGRLMYRSNRYPNARLAFAGAMLADLSKMEHFIALSATIYHSGDPEQAKRVAQTTFHRFPSAERRNGNPKIHALVLEEFGRDFFSDLPQSAFAYARGNFIAHMPAGRIAYTHTISDFIGSVNDFAGAVNNAVDLDKFDIVYNNRTVQEAIELRGHQDTVERIASELPIPIINHPKGIAESARDRNAEKYANSKKFTFPRTVRIRHDLDAVSTKNTILDALSLPLILRPLTTHVGVGAHVVYNEDELLQEIAKKSFSDFYAIEYHDCQSEDRMFRRYRLACIDGELLANGVHLATNWNVHGGEREAIDWYERGYDREELAFHEDPEHILGMPAESAFEEILENTPLDIYGFDFGFDRDGRIIVFEINAAMALSLDANFEKYPYRKQYADDFVGRVEELFFARSKAHIAA